jgi:hypothetical protein
MFNQNQNNTQEFFNAVRSLDNSTLERLVQEARRLNMSEQDINAGLSILSQIKNNPR